MQTVSIIGVGRVGGALALALDQNGYEIKNLIFHNPEKAKNISDLLGNEPQIISFDDFEKINTDIILITTQDYEIKNVSKKLSEISGNENAFVFHTSGSLSSKILNDIKQVGYNIGSIHPLVSISNSIKGQNRFAGAYFGVEGDKEAITLAKQIVNDLSGIPFSIDTENKALYHASAVTACGHLVTLLNIATEMLQSSGIEKQTGKEILLPLVKSTINNLENQTFAESLTGTFARGDVETLERHIENLEKNGNNEQTKIYLQLGESSLKLAKEQGVSQERLDKMAKKISLAKKNLKC